ncbi:MAG: site-specific DNA-methyltransferase [Patescibacteria group bacterium]|nr:site-specific DNA-methyltransferase [Patescibacteria group bacterium]
MSRTNTHLGFAFPWHPTATPTVGWRPTCSCDGNDGSGRCTVLDPFCGSGTTGLVARQLGRDFVGIDLNPEYLEMARRRIGQQGTLAL